MLFLFWIHFLRFVCFLKNDLVHFVNLFSVFFFFYIIINSISNNSWARHKAAALFQQRMRTHYCRAQCQDSNSFARPQETVEATVIVLQAMLFSVSINASFHVYKEHVLVNLYIWSEVINFQLGQFFSFFSDSSFNVWLRQWERHLKLFSIYQDLLIRMLGSVIYKIFTIKTYVCLFVPWLLHSESMQDW